MATRKKQATGKPRRPRKPDPTKIRNYLLDFAEANAQDLESWGQLRDSRSGTYLNAVKAAVAARGNARIFREVVDDFMDDIRNNVDGLAEALECETGKRTTAVGVLKYKIPSGISSARSTLLAAIERKIPLEEKGDVRAFNAIRNDVLAANREARKAAETPEQQQKREALETLSTLSKMLRKMTPEEVGEVYRHVETLQSAVEARAEGEIAIVEGKVVRLREAA